MLLKSAQKISKSLTSGLKNTFKTSQLYLQQQNKQQMNPYTLQMYDAWHTDPNSVDPEWNAYFQYQMEQGKGDEQDLDQQQVLKQTELVMIAYRAIKRYMAKGHEEAKLDPLNLKALHGHLKQSGSMQSTSLLRDTLPQLDGQLDIPFTLESGDYLKEISFFLQEKSQWTLREVIDKLEYIYCGNVGWEIHHIENPQKRAWLLEKIEEFTRRDITSEQKLRTLRNVAKNEALNQFFQSKFSTLKRFGIEGCDSLISGLQTITESAALDHGVENIIIGMPHRGRLNTLANVLDKPMEEIFAEFQDKKELKVSSEGWGGAGDVKYHLGVTQDKVYENGKKLNMRILANPSHLEAVNPCVYGTTRAIQDSEQDHSRSKSMGILIHGDSAFSGQGVVYESLQMGDLKDYTSGGLIHIIANNQIGFTTTPAEFRSGFHCTELAKVVEAPIFHVNADHPDLLDYIMKIAVAYRQQFKCDIVIDIVGYRRMGHNELDQPLFTQPLMYKQIQLHPPLMDLYSKKLISEGIISEEQIRQMMADYTNSFDESYQTSKRDDFNAGDWTTKQWQQVKEPQQFGVIKNTNLPIRKLKELGKQLTTIPETFNAHNLIKKIFKTRAETIESGKGIDMATAESLAFGSLIQEGFGIRLSGQDVERGTFSHRHSKLQDQENESTYVPFHSLMTQDQLSKNEFKVCNSSLSEFGVLGFEYGYSITNPNTLTMWEAQFGDFANGAQVMTDNFISTGETKWGIQSGLVMMLPHGMDGQGAEHSSARLERFLSLSDDDISAVESGRTNKLRRQIRKTNWQICNVTTSVNYFHALRRQLRRDFRKPLILFNSKKLLRFKRASSDLQDFENQVRFQTVYAEEYPETLVQSDQVKKVVICSGQVYYDLLAKREELQNKDIAIVRIEQLSPFPYDYFKEIIINYKNAKFIWCQEEHRNHGGWEYTEPRIDLILGEIYNEGKTSERQYVSYAGRKVSASTATGSAKIHQIELDNFLNDIFGSQ